MQHFATLAGIPIGDDYPVRLMGVINVSPESFFKGSIASSKAAIQKRAVELAADGADIVDVGARGTAPYLKTDISVEAEISRVIAAVETIREVTEVPISVDTQSALVAEAALQAGARILNDVSGLAQDSAMGTVARKYQGLVLMANAKYYHADGEPEAVIPTALSATLERARAADLPFDRIVLDPGIGFFRNQALSWDEWDRRILQQLPALRSLGQPLAIGLSRKSFIGRILDRTDPADRLYGSLGLTSLAVNQGIHLVRTHDVAATRDAVCVAAWLQGRPYCR